MRLKLLILLTTILLVSVPMSSSAQVDINGIYGAGHLMTDGGSSKMKLFVGGEAKIIEDTVKGFTLKVRTLYSQVRNATPTEVQAAEIWEINEKVVSHKAWNWSLAGGVGLFNEFEEGDDIQNIILKFETGFDLFYKVPIKFGIDLLPNDGAGDQEFIYALMDLSL